MGLRTQIGTCSVEAQMRTETEFGLAVRERVRRLRYLLIANGERLMVSAASRQAEASRGILPVVHNREIVVPQVEVNRETTAGLRVEVSRGKAVDHQVETR